MDHLVDVEKESHTIRCTNIKTLPDSCCQIDIDAPGEHRHNDSDDRDESTVVDTRKSHHHVKDYTDHKISGIKSKKFKLLEHPLDHLERTILISLTLSIVFTFLALISGLPIVLLLFVMSLPILLIRHVIYFCANIIFSSNIYHKSLLFNYLLGGGSNSSRRSSKLLNSGNNKQSHHIASDWKYCPLNYLESYWFKPELVNQCCLFTEKTVTLDELCKLFQNTILKEPEFRKFKARVVNKRFIFSSLYWECLMGGSEQELDIEAIDDESSKLIDDEAKRQSSSLIYHADAIVPIDLPATPLKSHSIKMPQNTTTNLKTSSTNKQLPQDSNNNSNNNNNIFSIEDHIIQDEPIRSKKSLRKRNAHLLNVPLQPDKPLWQIRLAAATYTNQCVIIVRCHQSLADGSRLIAVLIKSGLINQINREEATTTTSDKSASSSLQHIIQMNRRRFVNSASHTLNILKACIVGPFTCFLWCIWAFSRQNYNHLNPVDASNCESKVAANDISSNKRDTNDYKRFYMSSYSFAKVARVKEVTKSTFSEVILCALSGALRDYLRHNCYVDYPPNMNIGLTVDMRTQFSGQANINRYISKRQQQTTRYVLVNVPLPIAVEGAIPRLWETRHIMEELKTSADPWVMLGFQYFLFLFLPRTWYINIVNFIVHRNSSLCVSTINQQSFIYQVGATRINFNSASSSNGGIDNDQFKLLTIGTKKITKIYFCLQPPTKKMPVSFNCITYNDSIFVSCNSTSIHIEDSRKLIGLFFKQLNSLSLLLGKKKIPGTVRILTLRSPGMVGTRLDYSSEQEDDQKNSLQQQQHNHHTTNEERSYDLFKLINYPMTNLTSSISVEFIDKYCNSDDGDNIVYTASCDCDYCRFFRPATPKTMALSMSSLLRSKPKSLTHKRYCEILNKHSDKLLTSKHYKSSVPVDSHVSSLHAESIVDRHFLELNKRGQQQQQQLVYSTSFNSLTHLDEHMTQAQVTGRPSTEVDYDQTIKSIQRGQLNQIIGDINRRRSLAGVTEHQVLQSIVVQRHDSSVDRLKHLRYPTNRKLSVIGLAVGPGRRTSLVPFGSIAHSSIPKSHSGSSSETNV